MGMDTQTLAGLNADFDGDVLNILLILNENFRKACEEMYSPKNAFCISRNDGLMNSSINIYKDTVVNINAFQDLSIDNYGDARINQIKALRDKYKDMV